MDEADAGLCGQLAALGVRRVDAAERTGPGLLTVAAAARAAGERVLICVGARHRARAGAGQAARRRRDRGLHRGDRRTARSSPGPARRPRPGRWWSTRPTWTRWPRSAETLAATQAGRPGPPVGALIGELGRRGVTVRILDAGPDSEGAVTQLLADPAARDMARWAAWRQLTPAALYGISLGLGLVAAVWFAELAVHAKLLAIAALAARSCSPGPARCSPRPAARDGSVRVVGWLGTACGLLTELALYAALAVSCRARAPADGLDGTFGGALQDTFVATWGGAGTAGRVAAGHRRPAAAGRPQAGRARLRAHRRGAGGPVPPVRAAHRGAGRHLPGRRAVRGDRADLGLLRAAADLLGPARLGRAGGGIPAGRADSPVGRPAPARPAGVRARGQRAAPPTAATARWRAGSAPWSMAGCRRCRRCWWACS